MPDIAGLKLIVPTSVAGSGVSVSASGKVTFTSATTVNINGCFTSSYDNYLIVVRHLLSASDLTYSMRLRLSGTDASGTNYTYQRLFAGSTSVTGSRTSSSTLGIGGLASATARSGDHIYVYGPALAQPTAFRNISGSGFSSASIDDYANTHSLSTAYDGFTLAVSSGDLTGALCIYGLSQ